MIRAPGAHFVGEEAVWRNDWSPDTPLQFARGNNTVPPHSTLRPGNRGRAPPGPARDNDETGAGDPPDDIWGLTDSD
jgi:hypothetical protein